MLNFKDLMAAMDSYKETKENLISSFNREIYDAFIKGFEAGMKYELQKTE